jgi:hypothetical protein
MVCVYCSERAAFTGDHIFARGFFKLSDAYMKRREALLAASEAFLDREHAGATDFPEQLFEERRWAARGQRTSSRTTKASGPASWWTAPGGEAPPGCLRHAGAWRVSGKRVKEYPVLDDKALALRVVEAVQPAFEDREPVPIIEGSGVLLAAKA